MPRTRFVLRYGGEGVAPASDVAKVAALAAAVVVDASPRMLLVESDAEELRSLVASLPDWVVAPEQAHPIPDTRRKAERPPPGS